MRNGLKKRGEKEKYQETGIVNSPKRSTQKEEEEEEGCKKLQREPEMIKKECARADELCRKCYKKFKTKKTIFEQAKSTINKKFSSTEDVR